MNNLINMLKTMFKRFSTAIITPFRSIVIRIMRVLNINALAAKIVRPLSQIIRSLVSLKPQSKKDYFLIGKYYVYKKLFLVVTVVICAGVFLYFQLIAPSLPSQTAPTQPMETNVTFDYNDMSIREFSGVANIKAADGTICYTGQIESGVCSGTGKLWEINGKLVYEGQFAQNSYQGTGIKYYPSGNKLYEGNLDQNLYSGTGTLYNDDGKVQYTGDFKNGVFSGRGKQFNEAGITIYEGEFDNGVYHGTGKKYSDIGLPYYEGEFYEGVPQGVGTLYNDKGKEIFSGAIRSGNINIDTLIGSDLSAVEKMFFGAPRIFYTDESCVFVFEQAGIIVSADCRIKIDTWQRPAGDSTSDDKLYFTPDEMEGWYVPPVTYDSTVEIERHDADTTTSEPTRPSVVVAADLYKRSNQNRWYVSSKPSSEASSESSSSSSSSGSSNASSSSSSGSTSSSDSSVASSSSEASSSAAASSEEQHPDFIEKQHPDFIEKQHTVYFEVDKDVWQSEADLDKRKIVIKKVTVFNTLPPLQPKNEPVEYSENIPPSIEDCVAIDFLRLAKPTVFSNIMFEMDKRNRSFIYLKNVNFAGKIVRKNFSDNDLTYKYCYDMNAADTLMYYSVEG